MTEKEGQGRSASERALRKRLRKQAERRFPEQPIAWLGGILHFLPAEVMVGERDLRYTRVDSADLQCFRPVPDIRQMPGARGLAAAFVAPSYHERSHHESWRRPSSRSEVTTRYEGPGFREAPPRSSFW